MNKCYLPRLRSFSESGRARLTRSATHRLFSTHPLLKFTMYLARSAPRQRSRALLATVQRASVPFATGRSTRPYATEPKPDERKEQQPEESRKKQPPSSTQGEAWVLFPALDFKLVLSVSLK